MTFRKVMRGHLNATFPILLRSYQTQSLHPYSAAAFATSHSIVDRSSGLQVLLRLGL